MKEYEKSVLRKMHSSSVHSLCLPVLTIFCYLLVCESYHLCESVQKIDFLIFSTGMVFILEQIFNVSLLNSVK